MLVTTGSAKLNTPVAITGDTGACNAARGTAIVNDTSKDSSTIDVTLVP